MRAGSKCHRESGQDVVEFALIVPILVLLLLGIIEFGLVIYSYNTVALAAREGARAGIVPTAGDGRVLSAVFAASPGLNLTSSNVTIQWGEETVQVTVWYDHTLITAPVIQVIGGNPVIRLQTTATMRRE